MRPLKNHDLLSLPDVKYRASLVLEKNKVFYDFDDLDTTYAPAWADAPGISTSPVCQDFAWDPWSNTIVGAYVKDATLYVSRQDLAPIRPLVGGNPIAVNSGSRPAIVVTEAELSINIVQGQAVRKVVIDRALLEAGSTACASAPVWRVTLAYWYASLHTLASTGDLAIFALRKGGVSIARLSATNVLTESPHRYVDPVKVYLTTLDSDVAALNYSAAISDGGAGFFAYFSANDGSVRMCHYTGYNWTNWKVAIPADLSTFKIGNVYVINNPISDDREYHLVGQFQRMDPLGAFSSTVVHNLDCISLDGKSFSLYSDANFGYGDTAEEGPSGMLLEQLGCRFMGVKVNGRSVYISANRFLPENDSRRTGLATGVAVPTEAVGSISGDPHSELSITIADPAGTYKDTGLFKKDSVVSIYLKLDDDFTFLDEQEAGEERPWFTGRISKVEKGNIGNELSFSVVPDSLARLMSSSYPMYVEKSSVQSQSGDFENLSNLYPVSDDKFVVPFIVDLLTTEKRTDLQNSPGSSTVWWSDDLVSRGEVTRYPVITSLPIEIKIFGWSRAGDKSTSGGTTDVPTNTDAPNDNISAVIRVKHADGAFEDITCSVASAGQVYFSQTWGTGAHGRGSGSYPVQISGRVDDGLEVGDQIIEVAAKASNTSNRPGGLTNVDKTTHFFERIEIPAVKMWIPYKVPEAEYVNYDLSTYSATVLRKVHARKLKTFGKWMIYAAAEPYRANGWDLRIEGLTSVGWIGLAGFVVDSNNFIVARYGKSRFQDSRVIQIVQVNDGVETVLSSTASGNQSDKIAIRFTYRDGRFGVWINYTWRDETAGIIFSTKQVDFEWDGTVSGPLSVSADVAHVGSYMYLQADWGRAVETSIIRNVYGSASLWPGLQLCLGFFQFSGLYNGKPYMTDGDSIFYGDVFTSWSSTEVKGPYRYKGLKNYTSEIIVDGLTFSDYLYSITMFEYLYVGDWYQKYGQRVIGGMSVSLNTPTSYELFTTIVNPSTQVGGINWKPPSPIPGGTTQHDCADVISWPWATGAVVEPLGSEKIWITPGYLSINPADYQAADRAIVNHFIPHGTLLFTIAQGAADTDHTIVFNHRVRVWDFYSVNTDQEDLTTSSLAEALCLDAETKAVFPGDRTGTYLGASELT